MQSEVVGCMNVCIMMVVINTDSYCAFTAPSMTRTPSLSRILLVNIWLQSGLRVVTYL